MGWTTPRDWTDTEVVTAAIMNPHIRDNENYLYTALTTVSQAQPANTFGTIYQNGSKIRVVAINIVNSNWGVGKVHGARALTGVASPPTVIVAEGIFYEAADLSGTARWGITLTFIVPPSYYYKLFDESAGEGTTAINYWTEWDLL